MLKPVFHFMQVNRLSGCCCAVCPFAQHPSIREQGIGVSHLQALAAISNLSMLNLNRLPWAEDAVKLGPGWLVARLPHLRVLNASQDVLVRPRRLSERCARPHVPL